MAIGLKRGTVELFPYDEAWKLYFEKEKKLLLKTFGDRIVSIEHIGSTSIPGALAKPIIDINVAIRSLEDAPSFIKQLQELGYEYMPERWFNDRYFFPKGSTEQSTHHLNLVEKSSDTAWVYPLLFRNYLIENPQEIAEYSILKRNLALKYKNDRAAYTEAKGDFVRSILEKARSEDGNKLKEAAR